MKKGSLLHYATCLNENLSSHLAQNMTQIETKTAKKLMFGQVSVNVKKQTKNTDVIFEKLMLLKFLKNTDVIFEKIMLL